VVDFQILSDDYSKMVFACVDRSLVFHAKFGGYFSTRIPKAPRSVAYHPARAEVLTVGSASDVYRLNLELGRFMAPLPSGSAGLNVVRTCPAHGLLAVGGDDGALECFDMRQQLACTRLDDATLGGRGVTSLRCEAGGTLVGSPGRIMPLI
jgi:ribosome biogenesis protein ENP2